MDPFEYTENFEQILASREKTVQDLGRKLEQTKKEQEAQAISKQVKEILSEVKVFSEKSSGSLKNKIIALHDSCQKLVNEAFYTQISMKGNSILERVGALKGPESSMSEDDMDILGRDINELKEEIEKFTKVTSPIGEHNTKIYLLYDGMEQCEKLVKSCLSKNPDTLSYPLNTPEQKGPSKLLSSFLAGKGKETKEALKTARPSTITRKPIFGPVNKSEETKVFEQIALDFMKKPENIHFTKEPSLEKAIYYVSVGGKKYDLSELMKKVNFTHVELGTEFLTFYRNWLETEASLKLIVEGETGTSSQIPESALAERINSPEFHLNAEEREALLNLSYAQKIAIIMYTGGEYEKINNFIRGSFDKVLEHCGFLKQDLAPDQRIDQIMKEIFLLTMVMSSALNQLPDHQPHQEDGTAASQGFLYRGDRSLPAKEIEERMALADQKGASNVAGFLSTAVERPNASFVGNSATLLSGVAGKNIAPLSLYPREGEVLIPPTQIQWGSWSHETDLLGQQVTVFLGKPIRAPKETPLSEPEKKPEKDMRP